MQIADDESLHVYGVFVQANHNLQTKCNRAIAALDEGAVDEINPTDEHQVLLALADDACEKLVDALHVIEKVATSIIGLRHILPHVSPQLIDALVASEGMTAVSVSAADRAAVTNVVWSAKDPEGPLHRYPIQREYVLRYVAPRSFVGKVDMNGPAVVSRLYANFMPRHVRYALTMTDTEF